MGHQGSAQPTTGGCSYQEIWRFTRCKGCTGNIETQEHCLNVCQANIKARHDRTTERLVGAIPDSLGTKFLDQTVPGCPGMLRPDIVIAHVTV